MLYFSHFTTVGSSAQHGPETGRYFEVPAMNVKYFVGRHHLMEEIDGYLQELETVKGFTKILILRGMGGRHC